MNVQLRAATPGDLERTFVWANDPETRAASFRSAPIERAAHDNWFRATLENPRRALLIAELDTSPVGVVRLDRVDGASPEHGQGRMESSPAEISVALAPERRGQGLALPVLLAAAAHARALGLTLLVARIRPENERSLRSFTSAGFERVGAEHVAGQEALRFELQLRRQSAPTRLR